jgi:hypothetical protein
MSAPLIHADSARRWMTMSLVEQMANIGSEVERAIRAREAGNEARWLHAERRALELFDLTAADDRWRGARRREILRAREEFCSLFHASEPTRDSARGIRRYFLAFATASRRAVHESARTDARDAGGSETIGG